MNISNIKNIITISLAAMAVAPTASAANYAVFLHGRSETNWSGGKAVPSGYAYVDAVASWNGQARIDGSQVNYAALHNLCANGNQCVIYSYSTGGLIRQRMKLLNNTPSIYENSFASAGGGSELADACGWVTQWGCYYGGVDDNLKPSWARNGGNASQTGAAGGTWHVAGNGITWLTAATSGIINGDDDAATGPGSNTGCDQNGDYSLPTDCSTTRGWFSSNTNGRRKSGHNQWVTGGWHHFNIAAAQSTYWY